MLPIYPILDVFWTLRTLDAAVLDVAYFGCCGFGRFDGPPTVGLLKKSPAPEAAGRPNPRIPAPTLLRRSRQRHGSGRGARRVGQLAAAGRGVRTPCVGRSDAAVQRRGR